jgi:hypothetical protein
MCTLGDGIVTGLSFPTHNFAISAFCQSPGFFLLTSMVCVMIAFSLSSIQKNQKEQNVMTFDAGVMSFDNPVFQSYAIAACLMLLKMMLQPWMTVMRMMKIKGGYRSPEDLRDLMGYRFRFNPRNDRLHTDSGSKLS